MKLSVVMAVFNQADTLEAAVKSVLNQSFKDFEFIIVNDASTAKTAASLKKIKDQRVKIITNQTRLGLTRSLNLGLKKARSQYVARMDADDVSLPDRFKLQLDYLETHPDIGLLGSAVSLVGPSGRFLKIKRPPATPEIIRQAALRFCPFIHPTWMLRRQVIEAIGFYNSEFTYAQDYEFALRVLSRFKGANLTTPLLKYRVDSPRAISLRHLKTQERFALKARWLALTRYGYPKSESFKLIKPALSYLVPAFVKKPLYRRLFCQS